MVSLLEQINDNSANLHNEVNTLSGLPATATIATTTTSLSDVLYSGVNTSNFNHSLAASVQIYFVDMGSQPQPPQQPLSPLSVVSCVSEGALPVLASFSESGDDQLLMVYEV